MFMKVEQLLISYFESLGIDVHTGTKARGHQGFYLDKRIDISKNIKPERVAPTLIHEFAHYIHSKVEPEMLRTGGSLYKLFGADDEELRSELIKVTNFVDENSHLKKLYEHKKLLNEKIKYYDSIIKSYYPKFQRSKRFREFERYIKSSNAKYLLKYDRIKLVKGFIVKSAKLYTIDNIEKDFPDMPPAFAAYIRLKSYQKRQANNSKRINKYKKYYEKPTELFARFVESLYLDKNVTVKIAPRATKIFYRLLEGGYYYELKNIIY